MSVFGGALLLSSSASNNTAWNPTAKDTSITLSSNNLVATGTVNGANYVRSVKSLPTGQKIYFEIKVTTYGGNNSVIPGIGDTTRSLNAATQLGVGSGNEYGYRSIDGNFQNMNSGPGTGSTFTTGDVIGVAYDDSTGNLWWAKNNTWQLSGNPATNTNPIFTVAAGITYYAAVTIGNSSVVTANFGGSSFTYSPPAGFVGGF